MIGVAPDRFFKPPYVGPSGWIGVWLDGKVDWAEVGELVRDSYLLVAPKKLGADNCVRTVTRRSGKARSRIARNRWFTVHSLRSFLRSLLPQPSSRLSSVVT